MAKYYSNKSDFPGAGYMTNGKTTVTNMLDDIEEVTSVVKAQSVSHLYHATGSATLGKDMPALDFVNAFDRTREILEKATKIHGEVLERVDGKATKGMDNALVSLNDVNSSKDPYRTSNITYQKTHTVYGNSTAYGYGTTYTYETTETYTLAELLNGETSEFQAVQEVYKNRIPNLRESLKSADDLSEEQLKEYENMSDDELIKEFYSIGQIGDYSQLKHYKWQEDNKEVLAVIETVLPFAFLAVSIVATVVSFGAASPALAAAAATVATVSSTAGSIYGAAEGGYSAITGNRLITGTELDTSERVWCGIEAATSFASMGIDKAFKAAGAADDTIRIASKTADYVDDAANLGHIGYNAAFKGEDPTLSLTTFIVGKGVGSLVSSAQKGAGTGSTIDAADSAANGRTSDILSGTDGVGELKTKTVSADVENNGTVNPTNNDVNFENSHIPVSGDDSTITSNVKKPYTNSRPSFRKGVVETVWENAKDPDGFVRDPNTGEIINWNPGESRKGVWDMGHIPGEKYSVVHERYMRGEMTKKEFVDWYNDPDNYQPELPHNNRGHKYE